MISAVSSISTGRSKTVEAFETVEITETVFKGDP
jgi:hypothetical protein